MNPFDHNDYKDNPYRSAAKIGSLLKNGQLYLFLGAGVSSGFGLPSWVELIAKLIGFSEEDKDYNEKLVKLNKLSDRDLAKMVDDLDDESQEYLEKVHKALYNKINEKLDDQLQSSPLLLAVAGLLTGHCRGRINSIITYNYDDILEQYLRMLGYSVCIRTGSSELSSWADVEVNHVHGYLPQKWDSERTYDNVILSDKTYRRKRAHIDKSWSSFMLSCLHQKCGLFIGLSGDDNSIIDIIQRAKDEISRSDDYLGYWLLSDSAYEKNSTTIIDIGMCPIKLSIDELPNFIFQVCKEAIPN